MRLIVSFVNVRLRNKYRWKAHTETQKHKNNERIKKKEEEQLNNMTEEKKYEYFMIKKLQKIWNKVRL